MEEFSLQLLETALSLLGNENGKGDFTKVTSALGYNISTYVVTVLKENNARLRYQCAFSESTVVPL